MNPSARLSPQEAAGDDLDSEIQRNVACALAVVLAVALRSNEIDASASAAADAAAEFADVFAARSATASSTLPLPAEVPSSWPSDARDLGEPQFAAESAAAAALARDAPAVLSERVETVILVCRVLQVRRPDLCLLSHLYTSLAWGFAAPVPCGVGPAQRPHICRDDIRMASLRRRPRLRH